MAAKDVKESVGKSSKQDSIIMKKNENEPEVYAGAQRDDARSTPAPRFLPDL
jgi:hypothetical protein